MVLCRIISYLLQQFVFFSNDVQTTAIALALASSILCSLIWLLVNLACGNRKEKSLITLLINCIRSHIRENMTCSNSSNSSSSSNRDGARRMLESQGSHRRKLQRSQSTVVYRSQWKGKRKFARQHTSPCLGDFEIPHVSPLCPGGPLEVDLSYSGLSECPERIGFLGSQLLILSLSNNKLSYIPDEIGCLLGLQELHLHCNRLKVLPESIGNLSKLVRLNLSNNKLKFLPKSIGFLSALKLLEVTNNSLRILAPEIGQLRNLRNLYLDCNELTSLPHEIGSLSRLRKFYVGGNRLTELPDSVGKLICLEELCASGCRLDHLPLSLTKCASLRRMWVEDNRLRHLPPQMGRLHRLEDLYVRSNRLRTLPPSLSFLNLFVLTVSQNPLLFSTMMRHQVDITQVLPPRGELPPLLEITGRTIIKQKIPWKDANLPYILEDMLDSVRYCSDCSEPYFQFYAGQFGFRTLGPLQLPVMHAICSPHLRGHCQMPFFPED